MSYTAKQKSLAILPKFSGGLSLIGSTYILQDVLRSKQRRNKPYNRLVLGLSTFDMMASVVNVLSTWPIPEGSKGVYGAVGTTQTCTAQGFFNETGNVCTPLYNVSLCIYYMLIIRQGWRERSIRKVEPFLHALPLVVGWTMGVIGIPLTLYNNSGWLCWIAPYPQNCISNDDVTCERGELAFLFRWIHYGIIWSAIVFVTVGMSLIYRQVRKKEKATKRYTQHRSYIESEKEKEQQRSRTRRRLSFVGGVDDAGERAAAQRRSGQTRRVAMQAMLFVGALYLTWIFTTLTRIFQIVQGKTHYPLLVLMAIFFPLQGFFNAIIYLRPRFLKCRAKHPELSFWRVTCLILRTSQYLDSENADFSISTQARRRSSLVHTIKRMSGAAFVGIKASSVVEGKVADDLSPSSALPKEEAAVGRSSRQEGDVENSGMAAPSPSRILSDEFEENQNV